MSLSTSNKILLLVLYGLPINVLFSQRSLVDGYVTTPCMECDSPIATRDGEPIPELCTRSACLKYDRFPTVCLAVSIIRGGFKAIHHNDVLSLVIDTTPSLRYILPADAEAGFWIPRHSTDRKRLNHERVWRSRSHRTLRPPVWHGDERPAGARRVKVCSNLPSAIHAKRLINELAYPPESASAFFSRAHCPWMTPKSDRRKNTCPNMDGYDETTTWQQHDHVNLANPAHPYNPASPSRRTHTGGGLTEERVREGLSKMRTDDVTKAALIEIVYRRRRTQDVAAEFGLSTANLYVYASRLRERIRQANDSGGVPDAEGNLHIEENLSFVGLQCFQ
jgi:hypothetical protein